MLVLSRRDGESIQLGDDVEIVIIKSKGKTTQLGIKAPRDMKVLRSELIDNPPSSSDKQEAA